GGMARHPGRAVADQLRPYRRVDAVGADQGAALDRAAIGEQGRGAAAVLAVAGDPGMGTQFDQFARLAGGQHRAVQVRPVDHGVRVAEAFSKGLVQGYVADLFAAERIHEPQLVDVDRAGTGRVAEAEVVEAVESIGAELDAGADLAEAARLLEHDAAPARAGQAEGAGQAADAAAGDHEGAISHACSSCAPCRGLSGSIVRTVPRCWGRYGQPSLPIEPIPAAPRAPRALPSAEEA